jgi:long-subunit acyl-CoA synthetase (AMP-forming)
MPEPAPATLCESFQRLVARIPAATAVATPDGSVGFSWREYGERVRTTAAALAALGVRRGDTVALMLTNRPEFHVVDTAVLHLGATPFSIYNTLAPEQIAHLFDNARNRVVVCEEQFAARLLSLRGTEAGGALEHVVCLDGAPDGTLSWADAIAGGAPDFDFEASWRAVQPGDVATIIYTSGTTGPSKGVEITHANVLAQLASLAPLLGSDERDTVLSYLPDAHAANRVGCQYMSLGTGLQIRTVADPRTLINALAQVRPTIFAGVPQIWYKIKTAIETGVASEPSPVKRRLAEWALRTGSQVARLRSDRKPVPVALRAQLALADRLVLSAVRAKLGMDRVRACVSGAAPIAPDALTFMLGLGIPVSEGWGMSELTAVVTINPSDDIRIGTVGPAVPGMELKIAEDGEVLARGPQLMRGYRNDPAKTAETIDPDGWLHTGDIGTLDADGYLRIVDRKKELIINAAGKNMSPSNIEGTVKATCPLAGSVVAIGDNRRYVVALLTLDPEAAAGYAAQHGLPDGSPKALHDNASVLAEVAAGIDAANQRLSRVEQIKKFAVLPATWEPGGDELTPTMKLKRKPIAEKYATEIESLYT